MTKYEAMNVNDKLKIILAEAVLSRIVITETELNAFQTVMNTVSNLGFLGEPDGKEEK